MTTPYLHPGTYVIQNVKSKSVVDLAPDVFPRPIHSWERVDNKNQQWLVRYSEDVPECYYIQSKDGGGYLNAASPAEGEELIGSNAASLWRIKVLPGIDNHCLIIYPGSAIAVELPEGNPANGTRPILAKRTEAEEQKWKFVKLD